MFDWPLAIHTSPTSRFSTLIAGESVPATERLRGSVLAGMASRRVCQRPRSSVVQDFICPPKETMSLLPGSAHPQIGTGLSRCKTAPSVKSGESSVFAKTGRTSAMANRMILGLNMCADTKKSCGF
jgi:hypothetical protein